MNCLTVSLSISQDKTREDWGWAELRIQTEPPTAHIDFTDYQKIGSQLFVVTIVWGVRLGQDWQPQQLIDNYKINNLLQQGAVISASRSLLSDAYI